MISRSAFTLLEILFAVTLLAVVVAVCVPFFHVAQAGSSAEEQSRFIWIIDEQIELYLSSHREMPSESELRSIFQPLGIHCSPIGDTDESLWGRWIRLSDGRQEVLRWVRVDPEVPGARQ